MMIRVDPAEMYVAADALRGGAGEAAAIGTQLWSCAQCAMPANVQGVIDQLVAAADGALDASASVIAGWAGDLSRRADVAQHDVLAAVTAASPVVSATTPAAGMAVLGGVNTVGGMTIDSPQALLGGTSVIGGGGSAGVTSVQALLGGTSVIGGGDQFGGVGSAQSLLGGTVIGGGDQYGQITSAQSLLGPTLVGGTDWSRNPVMSLTETIGRVQAGQTQINGTVSNPGSMLGQLLGNQFDSNAESIAIWNQMSRGDVEKAQRRPANQADMDFFNRRAGDDG